MRKKWDILGPPSKPFAKASSVSTKKGHPDRGGPFILRMRIQAAAPIGF